MTARHVPIIRLLTIGDSSIGKSSAISRYAADEFDMEYVATVGIDFRVKSLELDGRQVQVQIWDTAGQERFRTITRNYFRGAKGVLLMYSISDRQSFASLERWCDDIFTYAEDKVPIVLIGTKADLEDAREVDSEEGRKFADEKSFQFFEISPKTGAGVKEAIDTLCRLVLEKQPPSTVADDSVKLSQKPAADSSCCIVS